MGEEQARRFGSSLEFVSGEFFRRNSLSLISPPTWGKFASERRFPQRALMAVVDLVSAHAVPATPSDKQPKQYAPEMVACALVSQPPPCFSCMLYALRDVVAGLDEAHRDALAPGTDSTLLAECAADVFVLVHHLAPDPAETAACLRAGGSEVVAQRVAEAERRLRARLPF